jgi:hypothetical protein
MGRTLRLAAGWTVRGTDPGGGEVFRTRPDRPWGPPSLLYNGYRVSFTAIKRPGGGVDHTHPIQDNWYSKETGMENCATWWFPPTSPSKSATPSARWSHLPCTILWITSTTATNSAWHSVRGWDSVFPGWHYQHKEFTHLGTGKSSLANTMSFATAIFS